MGGPNVDEGVAALNIEIGERLRAFRVHLGMTQEELGRAIGGTKRGVQDNELGKSSPQTRFLARLWDLGVSLNWLISGKGPMLAKDLVAASQLTQSPLDLELLQLVHEKLEQKIASVGARVNAKKKAEFVALLYDYMAETGRKEGASVERILRLVA